MGANQTRTVGGGAATPVANDFNSWLGQQLGGGGERQAFEQRIAATQAALQNLPNNVPPQIRNSMMQQLAQDTQALQGMPAGGGPSEFQQIFQQLAGGNVIDSSGAGNALQQMIAGGAGATTMGGFENPYNAPQFSDPRLSQLNTNMGAGQTGMADLSGYGNIAPTNVNVGQGMGQTGQSQFTGSLQQLLSSMGGQQSNVAGGGAYGVGANATSLAPKNTVDLNDPYVKAIQEGIERDRVRSVADLRARFGAEGAGALGTGAQFAEASLNSEFAPRSAAVLQDAIRFGTQQDLAERGTAANVALASNDQALRAAMASAGNALQAAGMRDQFGANNTSMMLQSILSGRGQDFSNQAANRGMDINQLGLMLNQAQGNQGAALTNQGQMLQSILQNQSLGNNWQQFFGDLNSRNMQTNNQNQLDVSGMRNNFNLTNAGNTAQFGLGTNQLNSNNYNAGQNRFLEALGLGQQGNQFSAGLQSDLMRMIFGGLMQSNALGTPQAETAIEPSMWSQILQGGFQLGDSFLSGRGGNG